jgi:phosphatidylglycerophosphatase A
MTFLETTAYWIALAIGIFSILGFIYAIINLLIINIQKWILKKQEKESTR